MNGLAAIAAAAHVGVDLDVSVAALSEFVSVKRRMELVDRVSDIGVYDDFAHHPTAIQTSLAGLRARFPQRRLVAVIECRSNTMKMGVHHDRLIDAVADADRVWWYEPADPQSSSSLMSTVQEHEASTIVDDIDQLVAAISADSTQRDEIVVMSNGAFGGIHQRLVDALQAR